jgi:hypothetical protein
MNDDTTLEMLAAGDWEGYLEAASRNHYHYAYVLLKPELLYELQKKLRSDEEHGIIPKTNPLIPVDFEMEIDGTGGIHPGNSFHSSYFSSRYKEESVFQMVGVNHTIDGSGWFTTIKGQIRSVARAAAVESGEPASEPNTIIPSGGGTPEGNNSGDDGGVAPIGTTEGTPYVGMTLGTAKDAAKAAGLTEFWWTNQPGIYSSDKERGDASGNRIGVGETGQAKVW